MSFSDTSAAFPVAGSISSRTLVRLPTNADLVTLASKAGRGRGLRTGALDAIGDLGDVSKRPGKMEVNRTSLLLALMDPCRAHADTEIQLSIIGKRPIRLDSPEEALDVLHFKSATSVVVCARVCTGLVAPPRSCTRMQILMDASSLTAEGTQGMLASLAELQPDVRPCLVALCSPASVLGVFPLPPLIRRYHVLYV